MEQGCDFAFADVLEGRCAVTHQHMAIVGIGAKVDLDGPALVAPTAWAEGVDAVLLSDAAVVADPRAGVQL